MDQRVSIITVGVEDLPRARAFYEAIGFTAHGMSNADIVWFQMPGMIFSLYGWDDLALDSAREGAKRGTSGIVLSHNVRSEAEVDACLEAAKAAGGRIVQAGSTKFWGGYAGNFADQDGYVWEVAHNASFPLGDDGTISLP